MTQHVSSATQVRKPTVADDCLQLQARAFFNDFWIFQLFFRKSLKWLVQVLETWYRAQNWSRHPHIWPATLQ